MTSMLCDYECIALSDVHRCKCLKCGHTLIATVTPVRKLCKNHRQHLDDNHAHARSAGAGPGTELSKLLKRFGINPTPTCKCRAKAAEMDAWGPDEAEKPDRIEEVVAVMREEAKARGLPFLDAAGRLLAKRAIRNARRAAAAITPTPPPDPPPPVN
jgi:hypothetical protein